MSASTRHAAGAALRLLVVAAWLLSVVPAAAFELQGHRGARGLLPENTLAGFERALEIGVTTLELDIAITADGVPVISHDPELNPDLTRNAQGQWIRNKGPLIRTLSLAQLQAYDVGRLDPSSKYAQSFPGQQPRDGQRMPTLAALFARVNELGADKVQFAIETKVFPNRPLDTLGPQEFVDALLSCDSASPHGGARSHHQFRLAHPATGAKARTRDRNRLRDDGVRARQHGARHRPGPPGSHGATMRRWRT